MLGVNAVHAVNGFPSFQRRSEVINNMNASDHQYAIFCLDLASDFGRQLFIAGVDLARFQRASEGAGESTTGRSNDKVQRGRVWLGNLRADSVVFGNRTVHAKEHRLRLGWQVGQAQRPNLSLNADMRNVNYI